MESINEVSDRLVMVLKDLLETRKITPVIDRTYSVDRDPAGDPLS
jgi:hypothetical protein